MVRMGYSPSVRLFEAAACGLPIISDAWPGLDTIFAPGREILVVRDGSDVLRHLREMDETERRCIAENARQRVLRSHTAAHRAALLESYVEEAFEIRRRAARYHSRNRGSGAVFSDQKGRVARVRATLAAAGSK
jgi:spore maturation protein CgeB